MSAQAQRYLSFKRLVLSSLPPVLCCRYVYEAGGMSVLGGVPFNVIQNSDNGELDMEEVAAAIRYCILAGLPTMACTHGSQSPLALTSDVYDSTGPWTSMQQ